jgi:hypothetical protein
MDVDDDMIKVPSNTFWQHCNMCLQLFVLQPLFMSSGIEEVFLSTAMGLIRLSQDSLCSSLRIYDSSDPASPISNVGTSYLLEGGKNGDGQDQCSTQRMSLAHAEVERTPLCC